MELSAANLIPYLDAKPRFAHEIAHAYNTDIAHNTSNGRHRPSWLERFVGRTGKWTPITGDNVSRALDGFEGVVCREQFYNIDWDPRSTAQSPTRQGWYPTYAKHP